MPLKGNSLRRREEHRAATSLAREILKHPRLKNHLIRKHPRMNVRIVIEEDQQKEVFDVTPQKKQLTTDEKLAILDELAGSADRFSSEGVLETIRIANREDWEEETK